VVLSDEHASVYAFNDRLWDTQCCISPPMATGMIMPDLQHSRLVAENVDYGRRAEFPKRGNFFGCIVGLHSRRINQGLIAT
jgi:hypothetical protein